MSVLSQSFAQRLKLLRTATPHEKRLWREVLRGHPYRFFRKETFLANHIVVDFYCPSARLAIEMEKELPEEEKLSVHELQRRNSLRQLGVQVLYITEAELDEDIEAVRERIDRELMK